MTDSIRATVCSTDPSVYKSWARITLRYADTDRQGHINNAVFSTLLEAGRVEFLFNGSESIGGKGNAFVIAKLTLDFLAEMNYPGVAEVASAVLSIGRTSFRIGQAIFLNGQCCSTAEAILVLTDETTRRPTHLTDELLARLNELLIERTN
jgi:acyl-CoA thioester hydrolase